MSIRIYIILFSCLWIFSHSLHSQPTNIGIPFTTNYPNQTYQAGTQNWDIAQHPNGFLFFANNNGLLQFDGTHWQLFPLSNKTINRSLHITKAGRIYVGGQGEVGYFEPNEKGQLVYHSILDLIPIEHRNFSDVWEIIELKGTIYFRASDKIYVYQHPKITIIEKGIIRFIGTAHNRLFFKNEEGLQEVTDEVILPVNGGAELANTTVTDIVPMTTNQVLFTTLQQGVFQWDGTIIQPILKEIQHLWQHSTIESATKLEEHKVALGTSKQGLLIVENNQLVTQLNKANGLQNNQVLSVFKDHDGGVWVGLDNGIDLIHTNSPFTKIIPDKDQEGTAYAACIFDNTLYLGTNTGLYQRNWKSYYNPLDNQNFQLVPNSAGQVWGLNVLNNELFLGHHNGGFLVQPSQLQSFFSTQGNWKALPIQQNPSYRIVGMYEGLALFQKELDTWQLVKKYENFQESCRILEQDDQGNIWVAHPYRGIYKIQLSENLQEISTSKYGKKNGLPNDNLNHVFKINGEVVFTGETGIYKYDLENDSFLLHEDLVSLIGEDKSIQRFYEDQQKNIWYIASDEVGLLKLQDKGIRKSFTKEVFPALNKQLVRGFEYIYPYDENNVFIGSEKGFIHFQPQSRPSQPYDYVARITRVESLHASENPILLSGQYNQTHSAALKKFPPKEDAFKFSYTCPSFTQSDKIRYATKLEGYEEEWSDWIIDTEKEYTNLGAGTYQFTVQAKTEDGQISQAASYQFVIRPPWYASKIAFFLYAFFLFSLLTALIVIPRKRFEKEKELLQSQQERKDAEHLEEVAKNQQAITELKNQQLQTSLSYKNQELAMSTMHLVQRNELILQLKEKLTRISKNSQDPSTSKELKKINRLLDENANIDEAWDQFAHHFDQVHIDFLKRIKEKYPELTINDQKLCAYLRMNLSTKEIVPLMNISIRGVEVARYRLRKKLGLDSSDNLNEFMLSV